MPSHSDVSVAPCVPTTCPIDSLHPRQRQGEHVFRTTFPAEVLAGGWEEDTLYRRTAVLCVFVPRVGAGDVHAVSEGRHLLAQRPDPLVHTAQGPGGTEEDMCSWSDGLILQDEVWQEEACLTC